MAIQKTITPTVEVEQAPGKTPVQKPVQEPTTQPQDDTQPAPQTGHIARRPAFRFSAILLVAAAIMLAASIFLPYWRMRLNAPQYPNGLFVTVYVNHMTGDISEIDGLNHYIGMAPLESAAQLERSLAPIALVVIILMILSLAFIHTRWAFLLAIPAISFPFVFLADMWVWLWYYGNNLDPTAALSSAVDPFTPTILGVGKVGQFSTNAWLQPGWYLALSAAILTSVALVLLGRARRAAIQEDATSREAVS